MSQDRLELAAGRAPAHAADQPPELPFPWSNITKQLSDFAWHDVHLPHQYSRAINQLQQLRAARIAKEKKQKRKIEPKETVTFEKPESPAIPAPTLVS